MLAGNQKLAEKKWAEAKEIFQRLDMTSEIARMDKGKNSG